MSERDVAYKLAYAQGGECSYQCNIAASRELRNPHWPSISGLDGDADAESSEKESPEALRVATIILLPYVSPCRGSVDAGAEDDGPSKTALRTEEISVTSVILVGLTKMVCRHME